MTIVNVTISVISSTGENYCSASFYFTKNCDKDSKSRLIIYTSQVHFVC